jgi:dolichol-phosphate mannosyltransferase
MASEDASAVRGARLRHGVRQPKNWFQLTRFLLVGVSGYVVNLAVYTTAVHLGDLDYRVAATLAFLVAVTNNFVWHRRWTFAARHAPRAGQATRFLAVSVAAFVASLVVLQILVEGFDLDKVLAQATAIVLVTPLSFLLNRFWSFRS